MVLSAEKLDFSKMLTDNWSFGVMMNFVGTNVSCKLAPNKMKNKSFIWDEIESDLFFLDKRATPVMVSGSNEQMKQQQLITNTGINLQQKQFDFTEE